MTNAAFSRPGRSLPRRFRRVPAAVVVAAGALLLLLPAGPACQSTEAGSGPVVITVGPREIPRIELEEAFWAAQAADSTVKPDTSSLRRYVPAFLEKVRMEMLAAEAVPKLEGGPAERADESREQILVQALRDDAYGKAAHATRGELQKAYELLKRKLHLRYIYVTDREEANRIMTALREGGLFPRIAGEKSQDEDSRGKGGDIGWVQYTELNPGVRDKVWAASPGDVVGPLFWVTGYQIFKVEEEGENTARGSLEKERRKLEYGIVAARLRDAQKKYQDDLLKKYGFKEDPAEVAWLTVFLRDKTASVKRGMDAGRLSGSIDFESEPTPPDELPWQGSPFSPADTGRVLARVNIPDGRVTPILVLEQLMTDAPMAWPTFQSPGDVERLIRDLVLERLEIREALARGLEKRPDVLRKIRRGEEEIRVRVYTRTVLRPLARPSDEEVQAYFAAHPLEFSSPEKRRFVAVNSALWDNAVKAEGLMKQGKSVDEVKAALAPADTSFKGTDSRGTPAYENGRSPMLDPVGFSLPLNGISDPIPVGNTFTVLKVIEIQPAVAKPFPEIAESVRAKLSAQRMADVRRKKLEEAAAANPAKIRWDQVMKSRLEKPDSE